MLAYSLRIGTALAIFAAGTTTVLAREHSTHRHAAWHGTHHTYHHHRSAHAVARHGGSRHGDDGAGVSRSCLTPDTLSLLNRVAAVFGPVQVVSTCRPGAVVAGTNHPSQHRYGRAVDFNAPPGKKAAIVQWLIANNPSGGTMTYASMGHIHMDTGPYHFVSLNSGGGGARHHVHLAAHIRHDGMANQGMTLVGHADTSAIPVASGWNDWTASPSGLGSIRSAGAPQRQRYAHHHHHGRRAGG
jgi:uncharacterized protein YcbK (DUF882 family)